jgi:hypothetical protein
MVKLIEVTMIAKKNTGKMSALLPKTGNVKRNDSFLPSDIAYLRNMKTAKLGKKIGQGRNADVFEVENNPNFVLKVPHYLGSVPDFDDVAVTDLTVSERKAYMAGTRGELKEEAKNYNRLGFSKNPIFTPTKIVKVNHEGVTTFGLLRPKVTPINDNTKRVTESTKQLMTTSKLWRLYNDLVVLTKKGYAFHDGLQLGLDRSGRSLVYDLGDIKKYPKDSRKPYEVNTYMWEVFLDSLGKTESFIRKFPEITRD